MRIKETLELEDFKQMELLEQRYYDEDFITPYIESYNWYKKFPFSIRAIEYCDRVVGFMNLFPVDDYIFDKILSGKYNDRFLTVDGLVDPSDFKGHELNLFLSCIVIDESVRKLGALDLLLKSYVEYYNYIEEQGINIGKIATDNVTISGERFSKKIGFNKLTDSDHGSKIYVGYLTSIESYLNNKKVE